MGTKEKCTKLGEIENKQNAVKAWAKSCGSTVYVDGTIGYSHVTENGGVITVTEEDFKKEIEGHKCGCAHCKEND